MNIRVDLDTPIYDGREVVFRSPVDCSQVTGLILYYPDNGNTSSKEFAFADAHGNNVGDIDHLFAENVVVKVILDLETNMAFVQNADTNAYLEGRFAECVTHTEQKLTPEQQAQARENIGVYELSTTASGDFLVLKDSERAYIESLIICGNSTQGGIATPETVFPVEHCVNPTIHFMSINHIPSQYESVSQTKNGVTWNIDEDGRVTATGTASGNSSFRLHTWTPCYIPKGKYYLGFKSGGDATQISLALKSKGTVIFDSGLYGFNSQRLLTVTEDADELYVSLVVTDGNTVSGVVFSPMLVAQEVGDPQYTKYTPPHSLVVDGEFRKIGNVFDEIVFDYNKKKVKHTIRIGSIDMGTLPWNSSSSFQNTFYANIADMAIGTEGFASLLMCQRYHPVDSRDNIGGVGTHGAIMQYSVQSRVALKDTNFSTVAELKNGLAGTMLYYPLSVPITVERDMTADEIATSPKTELPATTVISKPQTELVLTYRAVASKHLAENYKTKQYDKYVIMGNPGIYNAPMSNTICSSKTTVDDVNAIYINLARTHPNFVTQETIGEDSAHQPIMLYSFENPKPALKYSGDEETIYEWEKSYRPTILLTAGVHGDEKGAVWGLAMLMKELCESNSPELKFIRNNAVIKVIPIVCPKGFNNNTRDNPNGVNVGRDFRDFTQNESRVVKEVIDATEDLIAVFDFHNTYTTTSVYSKDTNPFARNLGIVVLNSVEDNWVSEYASLGEYKPLGACVVSENNDVLSDYAIRKGLIGATVESARHTNGLKHIVTSDYDALGIKTGMDLLANVVIATLQHIK